MEISQNFVTFSEYMTFRYIYLFITGNIFVIAAIVLERNLQSVANYLILSLGVADLLVAVLVMPLGAVYEVRLTMKYDLRPTFLPT